MWKTEFLQDSEQSCLSIPSCAVINWKGKDNRSSANVNITSIKADICQFAGLEHLGVYWQSATFFQEWASRQIHLRVRQWNARKKLLSLAPLLTRGHHCKQNVYRVIFEKLTADEVTVRKIICIIYKWKHSRYLQVYPENSPQGQTMQCKLQKTQKLQLKLFRP